MSDDIDDAIERVNDDEQPDEPIDDANDEPDESDGGMLDGIMPEMSGTGKPLDAYEDSPYRSIAGGAGGDVDADELRDRGEKHVARGIDGLLGGIVDAGHPFIDLGIGFVLITLAGDGGSGDSDDGYDGSKLGGETMDDTPDVETTGDD